MSANSKLHSVINTTSRHRLAAAVTFGAFVAMLFATGDARAQSAQREAAASATSRTPYQAYLAPDCLPGSNFCKFVSEDVPGRGLLEIQRIACQGWHVDAMPLAFSVIAELRTSADVSVGRIDFLKASQTQATLGTFWAISEQTVMFIPGGHRLRISLNSGHVGVSSYGCTISGYLTGA